MVKKDLSRSASYEESGSNQNRGKPLKEYDPSHKGPIKKRSCTDVICCLLFFIFILGFLAVGVFGFIWGDPRLLLYPMDSDGNLCGYGAFKSRPYLFFFDLVTCGRMGPGVFVNGCPTPQVCVSSCPSENFVFLQGNTSNLICKYNVVTSKKNILQLVQDEDCAAYYLKSSSVLGRCIPLDNILELANVAGNILVNGKNLTDSNNNSITSGTLKEGMRVVKIFLQAKEFTDKVIADVVHSWYLILAALVIAMILSLIWIAIMRWIAGFMVWLTIFLFIALFGALTALCFYKYNDVRGTGETYTIYMGFNMTFSLEKAFLVVGIVFGIIFIIITLILLFLCQRIRIAIQLIKEASKAIGNMMFTLVWPIFPFIMQAGVIALWLAIAVHLASIGRARDMSQNNETFANGSLDTNAIKAKAEELLQEIDCPENTTLSNICNVIKYGGGEYTIYLQIFCLFMLFWLVNFVIALGQMTLAGAFASYYWAFDKSKDIPTFPLLSSFGRCIRYHLGSLAFGSLLVAIVQIIRVFLEYLDSKLNGSENPAAKFFLKCLKCCFWCLEKFLKFINKNAYIMIAIYGKNFCKSAMHAFSLILRNVVRVVVVDKVTDFVLFVSQLVIMGAVGVGTYFFFDGRIDFLAAYKPILNFYLVPLIIVIIGSYIITHNFFNVYSMAVDTLFLCFLEDLERNDGSVEKPYFMSKGLMKILGKKNKKPTRED